MTLVLHIGFPKTGTTSLQYFLRDNAELLKARGVCYPLPDRDFKQRCLKLLVNVNWEPAYSEDQTLRRLRDMMTRFTADHPGGHIVLSCEELSNSDMTDFSQPSLGRLRAFLEPWLDDIRIVAYLRGPEEYYLGMMQESLKRRGGIVEPGEFRTDYAGILEKFETALGQPAMVRIFERAQLVNQDLIDDFFHANRDLTTLDTAGLARDNTNEALSPEVLFLLDITRTALGSDDGAPLYTVDQSEHLWRVLRDLSTTAGPHEKPQLFENAARAISQANADDGARLTRRYGIRFSAYTPSSRAPGPTRTAALSDVETVIPVDRARALEIWSRFTHAANQQMIAEKARKRAETAAPQGQAPKPPAEQSEPRKERRRFGFFRQ